MRSAGDARASWELLEKASSLDELRNRLIALDGDDATLVNSQRSGCWKAFLLFENTNRAEWPTILSDSRTIYNSLRSHFLRAIENPDEVESALDPLSENEESPWVALRKDESLRAEIFQDVERCMPDNTYFRQPETQKMMLDILFIFCKLNPEVGYRQGMHEVLAPILWVVERDAIDPRQKGAVWKGQGKDLMLELYNMRYIEHDTFTLFGLVMQNAKEFYEPSKTDQSSDSPMLQKCRHIFEKLLPKADLELAAHLEQLQIAPQMFLMRWMRLLYGREFAFDDVLPMWDLIFAIDPSLEIMDYVCIAMLLRIRWTLLESDDNMCIATLLRYPSPDPDHLPRTFVQDATALKQKLNVQTASGIIFKYSGRLPMTQDRPDTPQHDRLSTPDRAKSPLRQMFRPMSPSGGIEAMLQGAARDLHRTGERWGFNKAVRDAVGDFRRNFQDFQPGRNPTNFKSLIRGEFNMPAESDVLLQKIAALDQRNKQLSKMLEAGVADLWSCQKEAMEGRGSEKQAVDALGMAIARIQVMQVYLEDSSIPLPDEPTAEEKLTSTQTPVAPKAPAEESDNPPDPPAESSRMGLISRAALLSGEKASASSPTTRSATPTLALRSSAASASAENLSSSAPTQSSPLKPPAAPRPRPSIASSSFSWMLGGEPEQTPASSFAAASSCSSFQPVEKRERRRNKPPSSKPSSISSKKEIGVKGAGNEDRNSFLFGDDDDEFMGPLGNPGGGKGKAKGSNNDVYNLDEVPGSVGSGIGNVE
ncbi:rab-GTPase-TBC domain-containing protein [Phyllosticta citricarpa]|uniref:Rab-GTPase-TBC domain-containing protein n=2 Tax=Phyllosticta TaxID=121621 RepID=A0ABR1MFV2_9PEZI